MFEMAEGFNERRQTLISQAFGQSPDQLNPDKRVGKIFADTVGRKAPNFNNRPISNTRRGGGSFLDQLRSEVGVGGLPQTNRFQMNINPPPKLTGASSDLLRRIMIRTVSVDLPGNTLETSADNNIYGPNRNVVQGITYADSFDAKFLMDDNFEIHEYFQKWQELMYNPATWNLKYYDDYASGNIDIFVLNRDFQPTAAFRMWETYPATIGPIGFDMGNSSPINDFTVSFNFRYWSDIGKYGTKQPMELGERNQNSFQRSI